MAQVELHCLRVRNGFRVPDLLLSEPERHRAAAFRSIEARRLFVAGRFLCRHILGSRLGCAPQALSIAMTPSGRPYLPDHPDIDFNISHTRDRVALAINHGGGIGIDIERLDAFSEEDTVEIMPMILSEDELNQVRQSEPQYRRDVVLACWVRKEAALKCLGLGFRIDPKAVAITPDGATSSIGHRESKASTLIHSGRFGDAESGIFEWAIMTSKPVSRPTWHHHGA
ncbi:4'-phosphopantetheinyl transferase family protein [Rhizobium lusitanum]|uniref:4'-phosphopantetheinyl transferase n=1 Tax=Rhizobium lusitanum TaxID=293958 RepID=A0A7X0IYJ8_9HYPH|nr:4'-phosphopantetheinyl transferase superfamily protein [Rhizobium lusitanum]MBB6489164.1 4'-phosphopantetheinyl transferase [Rhizobium lusitanum]